MVLSNKKLKLKLRAESALPLHNATTLSHSSSAPKTTLSKREKRRKLRSFNPPHPPPDARAQDVALATKKENGSVDLSTNNNKKKRNKKRKRKENDDVANGDIKDDDDDANNETKKKKKKKANNNEGGDVAVATALTSQENGDVANGVPNDANRTKNNTKTKKKKKYKKKKKKANDSGGEVAEKTESAAELTKISTRATTSQVNVEVPTKVYVGGIPYYSTEDDIRSYFENCGTITEIDCMCFPDTGKFRGIAIISFKTEAAAKRALALDGADMGGLYLKIQPCKTTRTSKASDFAPQILEGYNRIYVGNLSWDITEEELKKFFSNCNITTVRFGMDKETGEFRGYAHVDFSDGESLKTALTFDQKVLFGRPVKISCAVPLKKKSGINTSSVATGIPVAPNNPVVTSNDATSNGLDAEKSSSTVSGKMKRRKCYECGEKGHELSACPKNKTITSTTT